MVNRKEPKMLDEFSGKVVNIEIVKGMEDVNQYHIEILPHDVEVNGKTGYMHEWIRITKETEDDAVLQGSVLDFYIQDLELCDRSVKAAKTHQEAIFFMKDKSFLFVKKKYGKAFGGKDAADHWSPRKILSDDEVMSAEGNKKINQEN